MADKAEKDFTPRELEIMAKAWNCMIEEPKVDYQKLAEACEMTNPRSASNAWASIKKKVAAKAGIPKPEGSNTPKAKATPKRKKPAKTDDAEDDGASPTKKAKGGKRGKAKKSEDKVASDGEDDVPVKDEEGEADMDED